MEVEGEEGSNGAWVRYASPLALFVLVLLIQQAASSDLLPRGTAGGPISPFHPLPILRFGEGHMMSPRSKLCLLHIFTFPPTRAAWDRLWGGSAVGTGCGEVGEVSQLCPPVPVHPCPAGSSTQGKDRGQP